MILWTETILWMATIIWTMNMVIKVNTRTVSIMITIRRKSSKKPFIRIEKLLEEGHHIVNVAVDVVGNAAEEDF